MMTDETKKRIVEGLLEMRKNFSGSDSQFAVSLGINKSVFNRIKKGDFDRVLSEVKWVSLARRAGVSLTDAPVWHIARTPVFEYITAQLEKCQEKGICALLCDMSDIGKTFAARHYAKTHRNAVYVDCSQVKSKRKFIRHMAREFGVDNTGRYSDVYEDLVFYLKTLDHPIIIMDEAGDLQYDAFLELKALYNAVEYHCAFYMTGADGLRAKMERAIDNKKVGYAEIFSRFGKKYGTVVPAARAEREKFLSLTAVMIVRANANGNVNVGRLIKNTLGDDELPSLRRIYIELSKIGQT